MNVTKTRLQGVLVIEPQVFEDARGHFLEAWSAERYASHGIPRTFVQDNVSFSRANVLRGLHYQWPGNAQGKLLSVLTGTIWDVAVDVRRGSPDFGRWVGVELSASNHRQLWIPAGFAHGFVVTGEPATVCYKCTSSYSPRDEVTIRWDDPSIAIDWPVKHPLLSDRDLKGVELKDLPTERLPTIPA